MVHDGSEHGPECGRTGGLIAHREYIEQRNGGYYVAGTRISLDSVVYAFNRGESSERILEGYPLLGSLAKAYGAIAYYLDHKAEIDNYLEEGAREFETNAVPLSEADPALWEKLQRARASMGDRVLDPVPSRRQCSPRQPASLLPPKVCWKGFRIQVSLRLRPAKTASYSLTIGRTMPLMPE